jgi:hypothetical protein
MFPQKRTYLSELSQLKTYPSSMSLPSFGNVPAQLSDGGEQMFVLEKRKAVQRFALSRQKSIQPMGKEVRLLRPMMRKAIVLAMSTPCTHDVLGCAPVLGTHKARIDVVPVGSEVAVVSSTPTSNLHNRQDPGLKRPGYSNGHIPHPYSEIVGEFYRFCKRVQ